MLRAAGSVSSTPGEVELAEVSSGESRGDLQTALDRLSESLERIQELLRELQAARATAAQGSPDDRERPMQAKRTPESGSPPPTPPADQRSGTPPDYPRVVRGGGPSAFEPQAQPPIQP
jgi:hypothetical protein